MDGTEVKNRYLLNEVSTNWTISGAGDLNNDGFDDIVWRNKVSGNNWVYFMEHGYIKASQYLNTVPDIAWEIMNIGDFDGDGFYDIFWQHQGTGNTYIYLMDSRIIKDKGYIQKVDTTWQVVGH
jgi:hypothetical protein